MRLPFRELVLLAALLYPTTHADACTGITLTAKNGAVVVARTVEWALSDAQHNKILVVPRNKQFTAQTPDGNNGKKWVGQYGFVSLTAYDQPYGPDGLNEEGLYVGVYYLPGYADYATYNKADAQRAMSVGDAMQWMLSSFSSVNEVIENLKTISIVKVENKDFGGADLPFHFKIADPSGNSKIIEIVNNGEIKVYEPYLGVITNSPTYDWHITNQSNYLNLSTYPGKNKSFGEYKVNPTGGGSGLIGLPGDFTPPSRFVRAAVFTATCRPLNNALDAVNESFRILDNFNIPLGAQVPNEKLSNEIVSATQVTSSSDLSNKIYYYHTMWNRQVRKIDLSQIDFARIKEQVIDDDTQKTNAIKDVTPAR